MLAKFGDAARGWCFYRLSGQEMRNPTRLDNFRAANLTGAAQGTLRDE